MNTRRFIQVVAGPQYRKNLKEQADVAHAILSVTKEDVEAAKQMSALPEQDQPDFRNEKFRPLLSKEDTLREKGARQPSFLARTARQINNRRKGSKVRRMKRRVSL